PNRIEFIYPDGRRQLLHPWSIVADIPRGTIMEQDAGGGGGFGDPYERPAERVVDDVRNGMVSPEKAREDYGVVVDPVTFQLDEKQTAAIRGKKGLVEAKSKT
ncbi:MAG: hydantoinase B/oxoprolinase family protein, partial [Dehalococcoidia bacterium]|nr:hydantoinase B/oxoprolinase family protein [Dehalococcoidia bacterium]